MYSNNKYYIKLIFSYNFILSIVSVLYYLTFEMWYLLSKLGHFS